MPQQQATTVPAPIEEMKRMEMVMVRVTINTSRM